MPYKSVKHLDLSAEDEDNDSDDERMTAEEAQFRAARLQKELEEQNKFDCLCDGVSGSLSLVDSAFNGLLELKDELLVHDLPPSLLASIVLITGKLYRSITDLHIPVRELTRLVSIYSVPWEQKSEQLKKLHTDYESKQRQLNLAIRKLQLIDSAARRMEREKIVNNWEKLFSKVSAAKSHGRRWKFMIEAFKRKAQDGLIPEGFDDYDDDDDDDVSDGDEPDIDEEPAVDPKRFMMSVITASPPQEDDGGSHHGASEIGSDADGVPSEVTESYNNTDDMSPDIHIKKPKRHAGVSFGPMTEIQPAPVVIKPEMKDASNWTNEPEYETLLAVRVFKPLDVQEEDNQTFTCSLKLGGKTETTGPLPNPEKPFENSTEKETNGSEEDAAQPKPPRLKASRRKSIGFAEKPQVTTPTSPKPAAAKPSSILKNKSSEGSEDTIEPLAENPIFHQSAYKEIYFPLPKDIDEILKINVLQGDDNRLISAAVIPLADVKLEELPVNYSENPMTSNEEVSEENPSDVGFFMLKLQDLKAESEVGKLPLKFYIFKKELKRYSDKETGTESIRELIIDVAGVDIEEIAKEELVGILTKEYQEACTSAMSFASSTTSRKSGLISQEELEAIHEQHDKELRNIQAEYEVKMQELILQMEERRQSDLQRIQSQIQSSGLSLHEVITTENEIEIDHIREETVRFATAMEIPETVSPKKQFRSTLPDWGAHLPKNVWVRMKMLTDEMIEKRQQLEARVRRHIALNIEKKLASQYKLQRANNTLHGPLQDVSLPAVFMPSRSGNVYNPRAHMYFHPTGTSGYLRLSQPPSIFQLPPLPEKARVSVVNLFDLNKNFQQNGSTDWLSKLTAVTPGGRGSRATTAGTRASHLATPNTPAPTTTAPPFDVK